MPLKDGRQLRIPVDEGLDVQQIITILEREEAPVATYLELAKACAALDLSEAFVNILSKVVESTPTVLAAGEVLPDRFGRIQAMCALAAYNALQGKAEKNRTAKSQYFGRANQLLLRAQALDRSEQLLHLGLGQLAMVQVRAGRLASICVAVAAYSRTNPHSHSHSHSHSSRHAHVMRTHSTPCSVAAGRRRWWRGNWPCGRRQAL